MNSSLDPFSPFQVAQLPAEVDAFINGIFGAPVGDELPLFCSQSGSTKGWPATTDKHCLREEDGCYCAASTFKRDSTGKFAAKKEQAAAAVVILLDDIGTKCSSEVPLALSWKTESSPGNYQGGLILKVPCRDVALYERVVSELGKKGYTDPGATGCTRWLRLPMGRNLKEKHRVDGVSPEVKLVEWNPNRRYTLEEIIAAFGLDVTSKNLPVTGAPKAGLNSEFIAGLERPQEYPASSATLIAAKCQQIKHQVETGGIDASEPLWKFAVVDVLSHAEGGPELIHKASKSHLGYTVETTDAKIAQHENSGVGPTTCNKIAEVNAAGCKLCQYAGTITSPIQLGVNRSVPNPVAKGQTATSIKTMADLLNTTFAAIRWVIFGLLPEGLAILSGPPKIGKSWMVMNLCIAVAMGGYVFGRFKVELGEVLLLSLEDNERRLKGRLLKCLGEVASALVNFHTSTEWKRLDLGGLEDLANWLEHHPDCKLVVIDTMQKIKAHPKRKNGNAYENDYDSYGDLQRLALHHRCCILVIHHNRKSDSKNDGDPLEAISGSTGVTGSMDTILMLSRPRGVTGAVLTATGRDISEAEYAMNFDGNLGQWVVTGRAEEAVLHDGSNASHILEFMKTRPGDAFTAKDIFERMEGKIKQEGVKTELYRLARRKIIVNKRGKFAYHVTIETALPVLPVTFDNPSTHTSSYTNDSRISNARKSAPKRPHQK